MRATYSLYYEDTKEMGLKERTQTLRILEKVNKVDSVASCRSAPERCELH